MATDSELEFHPSYASPDADHVLLSSDGVKFRAHSDMLKVGSGMFRGMLEGSYDSGEPVTMEEDGVIIESILSTIYLDHTSPTIDSLDILKRLALAAVKYDAPAVLAHARLLFKFNPRLRNLPLEMYKFACERGWEEEATAASAWTLATDLNSQDALDILEKIDTKDVVKLQQLHRTRRDELDFAIQGRCYDPRDDPGSCYYLHYAENFIDMERTISLQRITTDSDDGCDHKIEQSSWNVLRLAALAEMDKCSAGTRFRSPYFWISDEVMAALWDETCPRCNQRCLKKKETVEEFLRVIDRLPTTI